MSDILEILRKSQKKLFVGMAGPGTGKSHAFKIIIESPDYQDKRILILSFINKLVDDLSNDFQKYKNVEVSTLHSFAKRNTGDIDLEPGLDKVISEDFYLMNGSLVNYEIKFHEDSLSPEEWNFYLRRKEFYKYNKELFSFNSVIFGLNEIFSKNESTIPQYDLILIDEFQDFNQLEYNLIKLLNKKSPVVLVGDDNQSLYYFKKAIPKLIRSLYVSNDSESFTLDYCYRCTEVIVEAVNDLIKNAKKNGFLDDNLEKKYLYPKDDAGHGHKHEISARYPKIDFISAVTGQLLIYKLAENIKQYFTPGKRVLVLVPSFLKETIYDGLMASGFSVVDFEIFADEECNNIKHKTLTDAFRTLETRKDNLALRKVLSLYLDKSQIEVLLKKEAKIWNDIAIDTRKKIEDDIRIFKKVRQGTIHLIDKELVRFSKIYSLKNLLSKSIKGFSSASKDSIIVEMTTVMSSKGLSADLVYYIGIDDQNLLDKNTNNFTNQKICEFLVGITRAKEKLVLFSQRDQNPKILNFLDPGRINIIRTPKK